MLKADGKTVAVKGNDFYVNAAEGADAEEADADVVIQVGVPAQTTVELCSTEAQAILSQENCIASFRFQPGFCRRCSCSKQQPERSWI